MMNAAGFDPLLFSMKASQLMRNTVLFGGMNRERLVSVASAQAICQALPDADLWFWGPDGTVYTYDRATLVDHARPFEVDLPKAGEPIGGIEAALDRAQTEQRLLVLSLHGGMAEGGELAAMCEDRGVLFTGTGSAGSRIAFDKVAAKEAVAKVGVATPPTLSMGTAEADLASYGKLVAKPVADGSSYGLFFIQGHEDLAILERAAQNEAYLIEPCITGAEATCGVLEQDGKLIALPPVEIRPEGGAFDYMAKYLAPATREICPAGFGEQVNAALQAAALKAHAAVGASGYSRSDFIVLEDRLIFLEINTLPGLTKASLFPKELIAQGIPFDEFLRGQIRLAAMRTRRAPV
jgi:D-alanine-D-alanine ligase